MPYPVREPNFDGLRHHLSKLRDDKGLTYDELAERTGVSRRTLISIETGRSQGSLDSWFKIAQAFDMELGKLLAPLDGDA